MMELRSYNVERIWNDCVLCSIGEELGVRKSLLSINEKNILSMLSQIQTVDGEVPIILANKRTDGETWTPYLQIVEMLIRLGRRIGVVEYEGKLTKDSIVRIFMNKKVSVDVALGSKVFYAKRWQNNGYYPIEKFVYHEEDDTFEQFVQKTDGWHSWGNNNKDWWRYIFEHNAYILSTDEMKDNKHYNVV